MRDPPRWRCASSLRGNACHLLMSESSNSSKPTRGTLAPRGVVCSMLRPMCGIFGGTPELIHQDAERLLSHRGPDQHGRALVRAPGGRPLLIGQTRLNVVYKEDVPTP